MVNYIASGTLEGDKPNIRELSELGQELCASNGETDAQVDKSSLADMNRVADPLGAAPNFRNSNI
ncbi:uncharacterized protein V1518DRAFT_425711 [Limtongia smithiae]|uniref:uncharacterized protein n=1 Tax=Limtongia smithiae TaxID=1125753 RepID=UPI0034CE3BBB